MRSSFLILVIGLLFLILTDSILWIQIRQYLKKRWQISLYIFHSLFFIITLILFQFFISRLKGPGGYFWIEKLIGLIFLCYTPKLLFILLNSISIICRKRYYHTAQIIKRLASFFAICLFVLLLYSITQGRYNYKIEKITVPLENLPSAFQNFTIVQLSDIHLGSYEIGRAHV